MRNKPVTISAMYCTQCGERGLDIPRCRGRQREAGHLKKVYCFRCQKETNHAEVRPFGKYTYEDFLEEFKLGRFTKEGERIPVSRLESCKNVDCPYNNSGKCWNSNKSFNCEVRKENNNE